ncbi:type I restriction-modification system subunit M [Nostoc sp. 'Peltigera membranacea cyanobiont' N6]|uniref:type I restriction-modification system subunit M n=1 Tax=Nostoc sp. 'Peltigera membranacea cyanobiont' N6 TaxID=1261031 RepID=UPI000CF31244|nr:class I SAM-dependent DNA methyltransferase [Nostoc sp. 'Peltigera membranacea cyanobiont' N6]AVH64136.1 type I restriction-modification system methyltransferase subunit HsdM [Nostoc sp. 'Peltigera membranacea cyanobiont' N6]
MDLSLQNKNVSFIWSIADDCLRDVYVRGKYRDVILPMFVLRRLDCLLEETKDAVLEEVRFQREEAEFTVLDSIGLREASGYVFYNTSDWTLKKLVKTASNNRQILEANFKAYLDGFSDNVKEIIEKFELRNQIRRLVQADVLLDVLEKFTSPYINLSPHDSLDPDGRKLPGLSNLGMGYVFEELIRKFNEENNEEAGEHFTPRKVIELMTHLLFIPVKDKLPPVITVYDGACGSGGMLTESQDFITVSEGEIKSQAAVYLYGKEVNGETYAICKSDMMIKGNDPENIKFGSTLATDEFSSLRFDFMLSNPPYGKSYKSDQKYILDGKDVLDGRFEVLLKNFKGELEVVPAIPRSSDGQLLFLMDMVSKMKRLDESPLGSRIASVHNGSSLFTGDAGSGESNIRRYIIENDWLEAIIQLPSNFFYNTGITTYIWVLSNNKVPQRKGKVQLIDASELYQKLRKNLGAKNCEFANEHIEKITQLYLEMPNQGISKVFDNKDFGFYKITVERPLRLAAQFTPERVATLRYVPALSEVMAWAYEQWGDEIYTKLEVHKKAIEDYIESEEISLSPKAKKDLLSPKTWEAQCNLMIVGERLMEAVEDELSLDFNQFVIAVDTALKLLNIKLTNSEKNQILNAVSWRDENAERVVKKVHKLKGNQLGDLLTELGTTEDNLPDYGYWTGKKVGEWVEYESDSELRDTENVPLKEQIHDYFVREVRPHVADAWIALDKTQIGYEISFNKYFYQHKPLRTLEEVTAEILQLERETEGLLKRLVSFGGIN